MDISVVIVNYNVKYFLEQSLRSLQRATAGYEVEYYVIDNASSDGSVEYIRANFLQVNLIENKDNLGFGRANNQALKLTTGKYLLVLNPDTILGEDSLKILIDYLENHPEIGAIGPKVVDREGRFELGCRRGFPTPFAAFSKITGLAAIFPRSRLFAKYNMTYLDPDVPCEVDSLMGAFMLVRREVYDQVGGFDERFFMYGEDIDWCYRIKQAGWKVFYLPESEVIHYKGESTLRSNIDARREFFKAMHLFVKKHFASTQPLTVFFIRLGIIISSVMDWIKRWAPNLKAPIADLFILDIAYMTGWYIRYFKIVGHIESILFETLLYYNIGWLLVFGFFGVYGKKKGSVGTAFNATVAGLAFLFSFTYIFNQFAFSRFITLFTALSTMILIPGWRGLLLNASRSKGVREWTKRRTLLVGVDPLTEKIALRADKDERSPFKVIGFIERGHSRLGERIAGVEVIGSEEELHQLIPKLAVEEVIFSGHSLTYGEMMKHISAFEGKVGFKVIPETALESSNGEVPFLELGYNRKPNLWHRLTGRKS